MHAKSLLIRMSVVCTRISVNFTRKCTISTRRVWFLFAECDFHMQRVFVMRMRLNFIRVCVILTRTSVISKRKECF
jgi:hypothetical protein